MTIPPVSGVLGTSSQLGCRWGRGLLYKSLMSFMTDFGTLYKFSCPVGDELPNVGGTSADSCERVSRGTL